MQMAAPQQQLLEHAYAASATAVVRLIQHNRLTGKELDLLEDEYRQLRRCVLCAVLEASAALWLTQSALTQ